VWTTPPAAVMVVPADGAPAPTKIRTVVVAVLPFDTEI